MKRGINHLILTGMDENIYKGTITFINQEKFFATIEYYKGSSLKSVNFKTDIDNTGKKPHQFRLGDTVSFQLQLSARGDKLSAFQVKFLHNEPVNILLQRAKAENRFSGYLKIINGKYFIKEVGSYVLFPLQLSPWEKPPVETAANEVISFKLSNMGKPKSIAATLFSHNYIPEYTKALEKFEEQAKIEATVFKITPHAAHVNFFGGKIQGKLTPPEIFKEGDKVDVVITHLNESRIVIEKAEG